MAVPDWLLSLGVTALGAAVGYGTTRGLMVGTVDALKTQIERLDKSITKVDDAITPVVERVVRAETKIEGIEQDIRELAQGHERNRERIAQVYKDVLGRDREPTRPG